MDRQLFKLDPVDGVGRRIFKDTVDGQARWYLVEYELRPDLETTPLGFDLFGRMRGSECHILQTDGAPHLVVEISEEVADSYLGVIQVPAASESVDTGRLFRDARARYASMYGDYGRYE